MAEKITNQQFKKSECAKCLWLRKIDAGHYFCPFKECFREMEREYEREVKRTAQ